MVLNFSFAAIFPLLDIFLSKQFILLHCLSNSCAGVASESPWRAEWGSVGMVGWGIAVSLLVADVSLKVFAGLIISGKNSKCFCGMACGLYVETEYPIHFFISLVQLLYTHVK